MKLKLNDLLPQHQLPTRLAFLQTWTSRSDERGDQGTEEEQIRSLIPEDARKQEPSQNSLFDRTSNGSLCSKNIILAVIILCILFISIISVQQAHSHKIWSSCGGDPETARRRGCRFDLISFAWQTQECYDSSLVAEFAEWEPWTFWTSENGTDTVSQEVAFLGERTLWMTWHYHIVHCTFVWRMLHRAYEAGWIDSDLRRYGHTKHCQKMMLMEGHEFDDGRFYSLPNDTVITLANIIYPFCEKLDKGSIRNSWWDAMEPK